MCNAKRLLGLGLTLLVLLVSAGESQAAAVAYDASCSDQGTGDRTCSNVGSASATYAFACIVTNDSTDVLTTVSYGGTNMTRIQADLSFQSSGKSFFSYELVNPPTGTKSLLVQKSSGTAMAVAVQTFTGTAERHVGFNTNSASAASSPVSLSITSTDTTNGLSVACVGISASKSLTASAGETQDQQKTGTNGSVSIYHSNSSGSRSFAPTYSSTATWDAHGMSIEPNAAASSTPSMTLLGVGK